MVLLMTVQSLRPYSVEFKMRERIALLRFDLELGRHIEAEWFGWLDSMADDAAGVVAWVD